MFDLEKEIQDIVKQCYGYDPRTGVYGKNMSNQRQELEVCFKTGIVVDNRDPELLGRVRVKYQPEELVSPWLFTAHHYIGDGYGIWNLPDIDTEVVLFLPWGGKEKAVVYAGLYTEKHRPPAHSTKHPGDSIVYQTKKFRIEFVDEGGSEGIYAQTLDGTMRFEMTKAEGIKVINEVGDIHITCRKASLKAKNISINAKEKVIMNSKGTMKLHSTKKTVLENKKEVVIKGKPIKLQGSRGVTAGGKQLAHGEDKVMGFDIHRMKVPSSKGTKIVYLPHPYIGKLKDKLSEDVKVGMHNAATKGSISKHDHPIHNQLPGTIKFDKKPSKEGEITGGTIPKVKINGKEAAVIGSTVTTCNDVGMRDHSKVLAFGSSMPMPAILNPDNAPEEEKEKRNPDFTELKWEKGKVKEGEKSGLSAGVRDIADGNGVTFQVWKEGQNPDADTPYGRIVKTIENGEGRAEFWYNHPAGEKIPKEDLKFFFTAHSAWCKYKKSGTITVELSKVSNPQWQDEEGNSIDKGLVGETMTMSVECDQAIPEGAEVMFNVYPEGADPEHDKAVESIPARNEGGKARAQWMYEYKHDPENPLTEKPKYFFTATGRFRGATSGNVEVSATLRVYVYKEPEKPLKNAEITVQGTDDNTFNVTTDEEGYFEQEDCIPDLYSLQMEGISQSWELSCDKVTTIILSDSLIPPSQ